MKNKKIMSLFALGCGALLLVGCGTEDKEKEKDREKKEKVEEKVEEKVVTIQTLRCDTEVEQDGMIVSMGVEFVYDKEQKKLTDGKMNVGYIYDMSDLSEDEKQSAVDMLDGVFGAMCETFEEQGYKDCQSNVKDGNFDFSMKFDMSKLEETTEGDLNVDMSLEDVKTYFESEESSNMTCSIE